MTDIGALNTKTDNIWDTVTTALKRRLGQATFNSWFKPLEFVSLEGRVLVLAAPTKFIADWVISNYRIKIIELSDSQVTGVKIEVRARIAEVKPAPAQLPEAQKPVVVKLENVSENFGSKIDLRYTFESFIEAGSNGLAFAAAKRVAEKGYDSGFNPLFLHSGVGLGKTHLMHAIANYSAEKFPGRKVIYLSAEKFMHQYVNSLKEKNIMEFKNGLRSADILMIDDFQFIAGKESTQEEFFHTVTALVEGGKQLVISCDRSPTSFENLPERMRSRLSSGLVVDIHAAEYELRLNILRSKAKAARVEIAEEVLQFLAEKISSNVRELEGAFNRIIARVSLLQCNVTVDDAQNWLSDLLKVKEKNITVEEIQEKVAAYYGLRVSEILSATRKAGIARPRQVAMYLCKSLTVKSLVEIGKYFGGKDHTTVLHACRRVEELFALDAVIQQDIQSLISSIRNQ